MGPAPVERPHRDHDPVEEAPTKRAPASPRRARPRRDHHPRRHPRHHPRAHPARPRRRAPKAPTATINEAERLQLPGAHELARRHPTKKGIAGLRAPVAHTKRDLEARFSTFLNDRRFPPPQTNILIEGVEVDAAWPDRKLIVELDSWEYHHTRHAFENDRRKDRHLTANGWTVLRITWRDLDEPEALARELEALGL